MHSIFILQTKYANRHSHYYCVKVGPVGLPTHWRFSFVGKLPRCYITRHDAPSSSLLRVKAPNPHKQQQFSLDLGHDSEIDHIIILMYFVDQKSKKSRTSAERRSVVSTAQKAVSAESVFNSNCDLPPGVKLLKPDEISNISFSLHCKWKLIQILVKALSDKCTTFFQIRLRLSFTIIDLGVWLEDRIPCITFPSFLESS